MPRAAARAGRRPPPARAGEKLPPASGIRPVPGPGTPRGVPKTAGRPPAPRPGRSGRRGDFLSSRVRILSMGGRVGATTFFQVSWRFCRGPAAETSGLDQEVDDLLLAALPLPLPVGETSPDEGLDRVRVRAALGRVLEGRPRVREPSGTGGGVRPARGRREGADAARRLWVQHRVRLADRSIRCLMATEPLANIAERRRRARAGPTAADHHDRPLDGPRLAPGAVLISGQIREFPFKVPPAACV
jgi:hypothetical protein